MGKVKESIIDMLEAIHKAGYLTDNGDIDHPRLSFERVWPTKDGELIQYEKLSDEHLNKIISMFHDKRFPDPGRQLHYKGLVEELFRRTGPVGEILYGRKTV